MNLQQETMRVMVDITAYCLHLSFFEKISSGKIHQHLNILYALANQLRSKPFTKYYMVLSQQYLIKYTEIAMIMFFLPYVLFSLLQEVEAEE